MSPHKNKKIKVLLLKWGALGDVCTSTLGVSAILQKDPNAEITLVTNHIGASLFKSQAYFKQVFLIEDFKGWKLLRLIRLLNKEKFDYLINLKWTSDVAHIISALVRSPLKAGSAEKKIYRWIYSNPPRPPSLIYHEYEKTMSICDSIGFNNPQMTCELSVPAMALKEMENFYLNTNTSPQHQLWIISPGASTLQKAWPIKNYIELSRRLLESFNIHLVVTYANKDKFLAQELVGAIKSRAVLAPETTIEQLLALIKLSSGVICNNSGIMHLAYALNKPVICFNTAYQWRPYGKHDISIESPAQPQDPVAFISNDFAEKLLQDISVVTAFEKIKKSFES